MDVHWTLHGICRIFSCATDMVDFSAPTCHYNSEVRRLAGNLLALPKITTKRLTA
jgi:hypothetical protein